MGEAASPHIVGRYRIYGRIASGGMASVHFGRLVGAVGFSRTVAVKRLHAHLAEDPEFMSTMIDEARLVARIHHPNVVPVLDVVAADGELLVIMEYVRGESLSRLLKSERERRRVPVPIAIAIAVGCLRGLHAAHEATTDAGAPLGIVHRDVSPQNILVGVDGAARVIDFGVAKAAGRLQTTRQGVVKGKVAYMSPEHLTAGEVTRSTDIYAMGVVLWEMLAGKRLFQADNDAQLVTPVLAGAKEPPSRHDPSLPEALDAIVMMALSVQPADRFASAEEMAEALQALVPPAFPTDVGRWVEAAARDALVRRAAELSEIESSPAASVPTIPSARPSSLAQKDTVASGGSPPAESAGGDDTRSIASQLSSVSLETPPKRSVGGSRHTKVAGVMGALLLLAAGIATLLWRSPASTPVAAMATAPAAAPSAPPAAGGASSANDQAPSSSATPPATSSALEPPSSSTKSPPVVNVASPPPIGSARATTPVGAPVARPVRKTRLAPPTAPSPTGSVRFVQPD
jgi:serine/threonine protein kinase